MGRFLASVISFAPAAALLAVFAASGCGGVDSGECRDEACPTGYACGDDGCEPLTVPTATGDLGRFSRMALTADGRRVVATWDSTYKNLVLVTERASGGRDTRILDGFVIDGHGLVDTDSGRWPSVAMDAAGVAHVAWYDSDNGELRYAAVPESGPVTVETVDGGAADRGSHTSLALAEDGTIHVAYRDRTARSLRHAQRTPGGGWVTVAVPGCGASDLDCPDAATQDYGEYAALVVVAGRPRIAFYDRARGNLALADRASGGTWTVTTIDGGDPEAGTDSGDVGRFVSAALDSKRRLALAYYDATRSGLRFYHEGANNAPVPLMVDSGSYWDDAVGAQRDRVVGQHVALAFDGQGVAVAVYLDSSRLAMRRARISAGQVLEVVDLPELRPGGFVGLARTADGALRGAWAPWLTGKAPRTELGFFELPGPEAAP